MSFTYVIADLHGRFDLLEEAIDAILRRPPSYQPGTIITLGDYIDRGPQSREVIELLMKGLGDPAWKLICLQGNHEDIMLKTCRKPLVPNWWLSNGGGYTLISYGHPRQGTVDLSVVPAEHLDWIEKLPMMHVDAHRVYVHAGVDPSVPLDRQRQDVLQWKCYNHNTDKGHGDMNGHRHVVHGHHQYENGPKLYKHRTDLDTYAWYTGRLVVGVFDDDRPGGPVDTIEIKGEPHGAYLIPAEEANLVKAPD
jgi:serine/threonine protein phosphatase 1